MNQFSWDETSLLKNGTPWLPVMGEIHYSRFPAHYWRESIEKMKAGGIHILSTYVFWNHHEEVQGDYVFTGQRDVRRFLQDCKDAEMPVFLRLGPWCHGEVRHGGFPDWLLLQDYIPRSNDDRYFQEVRRFWSRLYQECQGFMHRDGGPVIGVQIENEFGHCGGTGGDAHIRRLTDLAKEIGFSVPLYTATGWGGAYIDSLLPVMGGYCEAPWDPSLSPLPPSENYVFAKQRNDAQIGSDFGTADHLTFDPGKYPYLTAELGGGLQVTYNRRPVVSGRDIGAMSLVKLGSGANLLGYYMYHGGYNPDGFITSLQETRDCGDYCELPKKNYDFQAPLSAFGKMRDSYGEIKLLAMFLEDFGETLCSMDTILPADTGKQAHDLQTLRYCWRQGKNGGYLFVNNHQRQYKMADHPAVSPALSLPQKKIVFPEFSVKDGDFFFYPFDMPVGDGLLKTATATPLCILNKNTWVFYGDTPAQFIWEKQPQNAAVCLLSRRDALCSYRLRLDKEYLVLCDVPVTRESAGFCIHGGGETGFRILPNLPAVPQGFTYAGEENGFSVYASTAKNNSLPCAHAEQTAESYLYTEYRITLNYPAQYDDVVLEASYAGNILECRIDGKLVMDEFYYDGRFSLGLGHFNFPSELTLRILAMEETAPVYCDIPPITTQKGRACQLHDITLKTEQYCHIPI